MSGLADLAAFAVIPILPAVHSVLVVLMLCGSGLVAGIWALRHPRAWGTTLRFLWSQKWSLLCLCLVIGLGVLLVNLLSGEAISLDAPPILREGEWSARGGQQRQGRVVGSAAPTSGRIEWVGGIGQTFYASPAVVGERVYNVGFSGDRGRLFCWNAQDGRPLWTKAVPGMRATFSSPVIQQQRLIVGEGLHQTPNASVFSIDLRDGHEGSVLWQFPTGSHVECTPVVADGSVYFNAGDDGIYALWLDDKRHASVASDSETRMKESSRVRWHVPAERAPDVETALCCHDGRLFVGLGQIGEAVVALDATSGSQIARIEMPYPVHGLPSVDGKRMYVGMGTADYVHFDQSRGQVACIDLETFSINWTFETQGTVLGAVACDAAGLICGCTDGYVYALDHEGRPLASWNSRAPILASPALADETVLVVNQAGMLSALDRRDLRPLWELRLGQAGRYVSSPVVSEGRVYVGTPADGFLCIGDPSADSSGTSPSLSVLPQEGQVLWQFPIEGAITASPGVTESTIVLPHVTGKEARISGLAIRSGQTPERVWQLPLDTLSSIPVITSGEIAIVATRSRLLAIDAPSGGVLWDVAAAVCSTPIIHDGLVWIDVGTDVDPRWRAASLVDGQPMSDAAFDAAPHAPAEVVDWQIEEGVLRVSASGERPSSVWCDLSTYGEVVAKPVVSVGRVYVATGDGRLVCLGRAENE